MSYLADLFGDSLANQAAYQSATDSAYRSANTAPVIAEWETQGREMTQSIPQDMARRQEVLEQERQRIANGEIENKGRWGYVDAYGNIVTFPPGQDPFANPSPNIAPAVSERVTRGREMDQPARPGQDPFANPSARFYNENQATLKATGGLRRLAEIRDYDGRPHGGSSADGVESGYKYQGFFDVNDDGVFERIYTNKYSGRWATESVDPLTGSVNYGDHGQGGTTRVVGIYIDPLVETGIVKRGSANDSQVRFQNDLYIDNLIVRAVGDYDRDGMQEVYWRTVDGTAYLRALMHADGNIQYANYQNEQQMMDYLASQGRSDAIEGII